jgi:carboxymethylenebutenolidase
VKDLNTFQKYFVEEFDAGITYQMKVYPGVNHAFHNDTGQRYVEAQATQAWMDTLAWFEQYL